MSDVVYNLTNADVGLSPEEDAQAWLLYEQTGSMEEVAKMLGLRVHLVKAAICRDQIRMIDIQTTRMEQMARRWEENETKSAAATSKLIDIVMGVIAHVDACKAAGSETDLIDVMSKTHVKMSVTQAYQWLISTGLLMNLSKAGFNAAKISEAMRLMAFDKEHAKGSNRAHDPSTMSDKDLWELITELEATGRPLPWGVAQWRDAQIAKRSRGLGT